MDCQVSLQTEAGQQTCVFPLQREQILNHQEAKLRLKKLKPGTEEYHQLQNALIKMSGIAEVILPTTSYKVNTAQCELLGGFGSSEHIAIGEGVVLGGLLKDTPLLMKGMTPVLFQHIVALAGDYYGVVDGAISLPGGTDVNKTERFKNAFATLEAASNNEVSAILRELGQEYHLVKESSLHRHCYSSHLVEQDNAIHRIKPDIHELLVDNSDHFSIYAQDAYRIGHAHAIEVAREAGKTQNQDGLKRAYAIDAFACHFLTDLFAAGHIRNQRGELQLVLLSLGFSNSQAKPLAGILTAAQHEKDGSEGLNVENSKGESWRAFGDGNFFTPKNADNKAKAIEATQASVNEVYEAYRNPDLLIPSAIHEFIPRPTSCNRLPIYSIEKTSVDKLSLLILRDGKKINIESRTDYLREGISQAIRYLPQDYITGYINGFIKPSNIDLPILDKVIVPQWERLTGTIWHLVGLSTYYQVKQESRQLNDKINEIADMIDATYKNSVEILLQIQEVQVRLHEISWVQQTKEIQEAFTIIKDRMHQYKLYKGTIDKMHLLDMEKDFCNAQIRLSRVFNYGTSLDNHSMLISYTQMLKTTNPSMQDSEITIAATFWFRQMLEYQVQAFGFFLMLSVARDANQDVSKKISIFEEDLMKQVESNRNFIDTALIYEQQQYIAIKAQRAKIKAPKNLEYLSK